MMVFLSNIFTTVLDWAKGTLAYLLRPNTIQSPDTTFGKHYLRHTPSPRGGARGEQD